MRKLVFLLLMFMNSQELLAAVAWEYGGVVGAGETAVAILKNTTTGEKTFAAIGRKLSEGQYIVAYISRNKIVLESQGKKITLSSQGMHQDENIAHIEAKPAFDGEAHFQKLVELGEKLVGTGELSVEQVNSMLSEEQQQWDLIETMDASIENTFGKTISE